MYTKNRLILFACNKDVPVSGKPDVNDLAGNISTWQDIQDRINEQYPIHAKIKKILADQAFFYFGEQSTINRLTHSGEPDNNWEGPFQAEATKSKAARNKKILHNGEGDLEAGIYIFDILSFSAEIDLPPNTIGWAEIPEPSGYVNVSEQTRGITYHQSSGPNGNRFVITTYVIQAKSRLSGDVIDYMLPEPIKENFNYTYYYTKTDF